jgi:hypothetical protein
MRYLLGLIALLAWALWFGGTIATFVFGLNLFHTFRADPSIAGQAASSMFIVFGKYELILAAIALGCTSFLLVCYPSPRILPLMAILILGSAIAMTFALGLAPRMEILRLEGKSHSPEFIKLHGKSMILMTIQSAVLLLTAPLLLRTCVRSPFILVSNDEASG